MKTIFQVITAQLPINTAKFKPQTKLLYWNSYHKKILTEQSHSVFHTCPFIPEQNEQSHWPWAPIKALQVLPAILFFRWNLHSKSYESQIHTELSCRHTVYCRQHLFIAFIFGTLTLCCLWVAVFLFKEGDPRFRSNL